LEAILIGVFLEQSSSMLKGIFVVGWKLKKSKRATITVYNLTSDSKGKNLKKQNMV
jgi:hypothetical protein